MSIYVLLNVTFAVIFTSVRCHFQTCLPQIKPSSNLKYSLTHHADHTFIVCSPLILQCICVWAIHLFFVFSVLWGKEGKRKEIWGKKRSWEECVKDRTVQKKPKYGGGQEMIQEERAGKKRSEGDKGSKRQRERQQEQEGHRWTPWNR